MRPSRSLLPLLLLAIACKGEDDARTALVVEVTGPDVGAILADAEIATLALVIDPETPFEDADGGYLPEGAYGELLLTNALTDDPQPEAVLFQDLSVSGARLEALPTFELRAGDNRQAFTLQAWAVTDTTLYAVSDVSAAQSFVTDSVGTVTVTGLALLDEPVGPCNDGVDNDEDSWVDDVDPDCASDGDELGFGATGCNDGEDNDEDGLVDNDDPHCEDANDDQEASGCEDDLDNDGDGWVDSADPDCAGDDDEEAGAPGDAECGDTLDNDSDGLTDADDPDCESGLDDDEAAEPCEDELDNDS
jgi:hypothetical protein